VRGQATGDRDQESGGRRPNATAAGDDAETARDSYVLVQRPVAELRKLRRKSTPLDTSAAAWPPVAVTRPGDLSDMNFVLEATLQPGTARSCGIRIRTGPDEYTEIGYDRVPAAVYVDRRHSGNVQFHPAFPGRHEAPARIIDGQVTLEIIVDRSTIEAFINDGEAVISDRIFPTGRQPVIEVFTGDASAGISDATLHELQSIWKARGPAHTRDGES
jgi:sucrose-6-phosphate hydrolase SacC (GH32 family)